MKLKFRVLGKKWTLKIEKGKKYRKKHGNDSVAVTLSWKREICLSPHGVDYETVVHELFHAYAGEMCLRSTERIKKGDWEEIYAEMLGKRGKEILRQADRLWKAVQRATESGVTSVS